MRNSVWLRGLRSPVFQRLDEIAILHNPGAVLPSIAFRKRIRAAFDAVVMRQNTHPPGDLFVTSKGGHSKPTDIRKLRICRQATHITVIKHLYVSLRRRIARPLPKRQPAAQQMDGVRGCGRHYGAERADVFYRHLLLPEHILESATSPKIHFRHKHAVSAARVERR